ncbi:hypothetical protein [Methanococcoides sp. FTZ1]|uniref:hypothetical protein n=1 Tax=Methanococcoides sp. FTZ1 TaxID=3439061 RepID=UPI003F863C6F
MQRSYPIGLITMLVLLSLMGAGCISSVFPQQENDDQLEINLNFNSTEAIEITKRETVIATYLEQSFKQPDWRVTRTTLVNESPYELNTTAMQKRNIWKVEMMERTCACQKISTLYVVESYVSADTGELLGHSQNMVSEREYDNQTCATTACH